MLCDINAGGWEDWRPDAQSFPASALGKDLDQWPGERWLDTRDETVRGLITDRITMCADKGFDGVDPDNVDGTAQTTGFPSLRLIARIM